MCCRKMPSFLRNVYAIRKKLLIYKQISLEVVFCYKGCFGTKEGKSRLTQYLCESFNHEACFQSHIVNSVECLHNRSHRFSVKSYKSFSESSKLKHKLQKASIIADFNSAQRFFFYFCLQTMKTKLNCKQGHSGSQSHSCPFYCCSSENSAELDSPSSGFPYRCKSIVDTLIRFGVDLINRLQIEKVVEKSLRRW